MKNFSRQTPQVIHDLMDEINHLDGIEDMVTLADVSLKKKYLNSYKDAIPSSSVIVSSNHVLYPQLRSRGIGCGMSLIKTSLIKDDVKLDQLEKIVFSYIQQSLWQKIYRLGFCMVKKLKNHHFTLHSNYSPDPLERLDDIQMTMNQLTNHARMLSGNHYLEIGEISKISDTNAAKQWGVELGQIVFLIHNAGEHLKYFVDEMMNDDVLKQNTFVPVEDPKEINKWRKAVDLALARSNMIKLQSYQFIQKALKSVFPQASLDVVYQAFHNSIYVEQDQFVYRHNSIKAEVDRPAFISGSWNHPSYLCKGGTKLKKTFHTLDHGFGHVLSSDKHLQKTKQTALLFRYKAQGSLTTSTDRILQESRQVQEVMQTYQEEKLLSPVATLKPLVNVKQI